jgi:enamine deaminase RidA (YjgF/YER057c/UK114 family)
MANKRGLGPVIIGGARMPWGKGVVAGGLVFLSGLEGRTDDAGTPIIGIEEQTHLALTRGKQYLEEAGSNVENIVRMIQYLSDPDLMSGFHKARDEFLRVHAPRLLAEQSYAGVLLVQRFSRLDRLVEIEIIAAASGE